MSIQNNPFEPINKRLSNIESLLLDIKHNPASLPQKNPDNPMNIGGLSILTGKSLPTIYGYVQRREIPFHKKGNRLYFFESEIIDWIKSGREKTVKEIEEEVDSSLSNRKK